MSANEFQEALIRAEDSLIKALSAINISRMQIALVVDESGRLNGVVTDGDIRRGILDGVGLEEEVRRVMNPSPVTARPGTTPEELLALMNNRSIKQVPLVDDDGRVVGLERLDNLFRGPAVKDNPVLVLAGGQGIRLHSYTVDTPKPLLKVGDRPILELILLQFRAYGFHRFYIALNYLADQIETYFGDGANHGISIQYLKEQTALGTAGSLSLLPKPLDIPCFVVNGDLLTRVDIGEMLNFHENGGYGLTVGVKEYSSQLPFGVVLTKEDLVVGFQEKPSDTRLINTGIYVVNPDVVALVPSDRGFGMNELIEKVIPLEDNPVGAFHIHEFWMDIGTVPDYQKAQWDHPEQFGEKPSIPPGLPR